MSGSPPLSKLTTTSGWASTYQQAEVWSPSPRFAGGGSSLKLIDASQDVRKKTNWAASAAGGSGPQHARVMLHPETAAEFQNSRRADLLELEQEYDLTIEVVPNHNLHRPESDLEWSGARKPAPARPPASPLVWGVQLPAATRQGIAFLTRDAAGGDLVIGADGQVTLGPE